MVWLGAFIWVLAHKEKNTDTTSETESQHEQKGFYFFLSNPSEEEQQKPQKPASVAHVFHPFVFSP